VKGGEIARQENIYWQYDLKIKELENELGIVSNATGACMAIRKELFKSLRPVDDVDRTTIIDITCQGYKTAYAKNAIAYDIPPHTAETEYSMRVRGTAKTVRSYFTRLKFTEWLKNLKLAWAVFSHKIFRYGIPYALIIAFVANAFILSKGTYYQVMFSIQIAFYLFALLGWIGSRVNRQIPLASAAFALCIAMCGQMVGVARAVTGRIRITYKTDDMFQ
jgi:cellulose synthase/poly-beta-1,6-N-acetylglucosamine synthase-like glycosyltransferase